MSQLTRELSALAGQWIVTETAVLVAPQPNPPTLLAVFSPLRWALIFANALVGSNNWTVSTDPGPVTGQGLPLAVGQTVLLSYRDYGGLIQQAWFAPPPPGAQPVTLTIWEVLLQQ